MNLLWVQRTQMYGAHEQGGIPSTGKKAYLINVTFSTSQPTVAP